MEENFVNIIEYILTINNCIVYGLSKCNHVMERKTQNPNHND